MHLATTAAYLAEDRLSDEHAILNGIRQGCPLAPVLFIIAVDTLYDQLAATPGLEGVQLPSGERVAAGGFADDTTAYLTHPKMAPRLRTALEVFAAASGLEVNVSKCQAIALSRNGWASDVGDIGFPRLAADQMARSLGMQVASALNSDLVWELTVLQLRARLSLAEVRTTDVIQRAQVAQAIIVPKLMYIGRHLWPTAPRIQMLQQLVHNYVWQGRFVLESKGRAWMSHDTAALSRREGGIDIPDITHEFLQLSVAAHMRWSEAATGIRGTVGNYMRGTMRQGLDRERPTRNAAVAPRLERSMPATGAAIAAAMVAQPRTPREHELSNELLARPGRGTLETRWWGGDWFFADYSSEGHQLRALRKFQADTHGIFDFHALMQARVCGDGVLVGPDGREASVGLFPGLVRATDLIGGVLEIQWAGPHRIRVRSRRLTFPLAPAAAQSLRRLCDIIVYNYPAVLTPHDPIDVIQVHPATIDMWRLHPTTDAGFLLRWEPSAGISIDMGIVRTTRDVSAKVRKALDDPGVHAHDHAWLCPLRTIWRQRAAPITKASTRRHVRAAQTERGLRENRERGLRLTEADECIGAALGRRKWAAIDTLDATTSRQRLQLRRFKGDRVSGWDRLHERRGCPHCEHAEDGGSLPHIFWTCPAAQALWQVLLDGWSRFDIWDEKRDVRGLLKDAAFNLRLPRFPKGAWELHELAGIEKHDAAMVSAIHHAVMVAWQQQIFETWSAIWKWRHNIEQGKQQWTTGMAQSYLSNVLRFFLRGVGDKLPQVAALRDPRRPLLAWLARGFEGEHGERAH